MNEYLFSSDEEKLELLDTVWNNMQLTNEQKAVILEEAARLYNKLKCKE